MKAGIKDRFLLGQYFSASSPIHSLDPRLKIVATLLFMVALFFTSFWAMYALFFIILVCCLLISGIPLRVFWQGMRVILFFMAFTLIFNFFFTPGDTVFSVGFVRLTRQGLINGILMGARLFLLIAFATLLTLTTKPTQMTDGIEALLSPLTVIRFPAHEIAMMTSIALRFVPTILEEAERIIEAQRVRGADFSAGGPIKRGRAMIPLLVPLFISSFRRADELAQAMEAKGYTGGNKRSHWKPLVWARADTFVLIGFIVLLSLSVFSGIYLDTPAH